MAAVIGALRVVLGIDTAAFTDGLKQAQGRLASVGKSLQSTGKAFTANLSAPIAAIGSALGGLAIQSANSAVELQNQARLANASMVEFQRFAAGAKSVGIENDKLSDILKDVNDKVGDFLASGGGEMADFFENIAPKVGVTAEQFKALSGPQALQLYVSSLEKAGVSQQEMTFYMEAIADEASALVPVLANNGAEMQRLGDRAEHLGLTQEGVAQSGRAFQEAMNSLRGAVGNLGDALVSSGLLDVLAQIINRLADWASQIRGVSPEMVQFAAIFGGLAAAIGPVLIAIGAVVAVLGTMAAPVIAVTAAIAALVAGLIVFWPEVVKAKDAVIQFGTQAIDWIVAKFNILDELLGGIPGKFLQIGRDIVDGLLRGLQEKWESVTGWITQGAQGMVARVKDALGIHSPSTVFADIGRDTMLGLNQGLSDNQGMVEDNVEDFSRSIASALQGILTGATNWRDALSGLLQGTLNNLSNSMISSGISGAFNVAGIPGFANGTNFAPGGLAVVGERGPELVNLPRGSQVTPNSKIGSIGGENVVRVELGQNLVGSILTKAKNTSVQLAQAAQAGATRNGPREFRDAERRGMA